MGATGSVEKPAESAPASARVEPTSTKADVKPQASSARAALTKPKTAKVAPIAIETAKVAPIVETEKGKEAEKPKESRAAGQEEGGGGGGDTEVGTEQREAGGDETAKQAAKEGTKGERQDDAAAPAAAVAEDKKVRADTEDSIVSSGSVVKASSFLITESPNTPFFDSVTLRDDKGKIYLPRGGTVVNTKLGPIQFGMPPVRFD